MEPRERAGAVPRPRAREERRERLTRAGKRAAFVATGQTGIAIAGKGIAVDAVVSDFIAGAAERMVCDAAESADWVISAFNSRRRADIKSRR